MRDHPLAHLASSSVSWLTWASRSGSSSHRRGVQYDGLSADAGDDSTPGGTFWYLFSQYNLPLDFTYPLMASLFVYLTLTFVNYFKEQKQRQQIRAAFGFYLSPAFVEQLARSPEKLVLGGEERRMTVLFSDVRGFTTISESYKHDPQRLTRLMNRFLTPLTNATWRSGTRRWTIPNKRSTPARPPWKCLLGQTSSISSSSTRRTRMVEHTGRCTSGSG